MVGWLCGSGRPSVLNSCCHLKSYLLYSRYIFLCVVKKTSSPLCLVLCKSALWPLEMEIRPGLLALELSASTQRAISPTFISIFLMLFAVIFKFLTSTEPSYQKYHFFAEALPWPVYLSRSAYLICCCFLLDFTPLELTPIFLLNS